MAEVIYKAEEYECWDIDELIGGELAIISDCQDNSVIGYKVLISNDEDLSFIYLDDGMQCHENEIRRLDYKFHSIPNGEEFILIQRLEVEK